MYCPKVLWTTNPKAGMKKGTMNSSIRNRLPGTIAKIVSDKVMSELVIQTAAGNVTSIITTGSVQRMNLKEGDHVFAMIKATEVSRKCPLKRNKHPPFVTPLRSPPAQRSARR
jgi:molybdopterin-binding protein